MPTPGATDSAPAAGVAVSPPTDPSLADRVLDTVDALVMVMDREGRIVRFNRACEDASGWSAREVIGRTFSFLIPEDERDRVARQFQVLADQLPAHHTYENHWQTRDGRLRLIAWSSSTLRSPDGRVAWVIGTGQDITDRERLDEEIRKVQRLESLGLLAGGIAHDFNNLLQGILANLSLVRNLPPDDPAVATALDRAERAAQNATGLTRQLLTFARGGEPQRAVIDLGALVRDEVEFCLRGSPAGAEVSLPADLPAVEGDAGQLRQVFQNLLVNARQAMPAGGTVRVTGREVAVGGQSMVRVRIADDGPGIPPDARSRVFDPFYSRRPGGTGLGLSVAHSVVTRHGGQIRLVPAKGRGATFEVDLPAYTDAPPGQAPTPPPADGFRWRGRALVMDDDQLVREALVELLEHYGLEVVGVPDGAAALGAWDAAGGRFDLVLVDLTVPAGMGGEELAARLRARGAEVPMVVSSGYGDNALLARAREHGFAGVLPKPYGAEAVRELLATVLGPPLG